MNVRERLANIAANVDDLQSGLKAGSRAVDTLGVDTGKSNGLPDASLVRSVMRHVKHLQAWARDQQIAMQELRNSIARLRDELRLPQRAVQPPLVGDRDARR